MGNRGFHSHGATSIAGWLFSMGKSHPEIDALGVPPISGNPQIIPLEMLAVLVFGSQGPFQPPIYGMENPFGDLRATTTQKGYSRVRSCSGKSGTRVNGGGRQLRIICPGGLLEFTNGHPGIFKYIQVPNGGT